MHKVRRFFGIHKSFLYAIGFLVVFATTISYANPPSSPYSAGTTLDPQCAPGSLNCTVAGGGTGMAGVTTFNTRSGTVILTSSDVTSALTSGSITSSKLVGTDITTVGTITTGTWSGLFGAVSGANLTNLTAANISAGTAPISITGNAGTVTTNANLTGAITSSGNATSLGSFTSANLSGALTDETGSGAAVFATSPTISGATLSGSTLTTTSVNGVTLTTGGSTSSFLNANGTYSTPAGGGGSSYTFSNGLTNTAGTVTNDLSTGISGGQSVIGGTGAGENLTLVSTSNTTKGKIILGASGTSAYDDTTGFLGIGTASPTSIFQVVDTSTTTPRGILSDQYNNGTQGARITMRKSRGTPTSPAVILSGDVLGSWTAAGYDGSTFVDAGKLLITSAGTIGTGIIPSTMQLQTMNSSGTLTTGLSIDQSQHVSIPFLSSNGLIKSSGGTGTLSIATGDTDYQNPIIVTTTGTSGAATFSGDVLNIPAYAAGVTSVSNADGSLTISPTSGAVVASLNTAHANTFTAAQTFSSAPLTISGNQSLAAWTTNGTQLSVAAAILNDTTSSGTIAINAGSAFGIPTFAALSSTTYTNGATLYIAGAPTAGTNVAITNKYALYIAAGNSNFAGTVIASGLSSSTSVASGQAAGFQAGNSLPGADIATGGQNILPAQSNAALLFAGASNVQIRALFSGQGSTSLTANSSYSNVIIGAAPVTIPTASTSALLASTVINPVGTITLTGTGAVTNTASLYINGASGGTVTGTNYALWVNSGLSQFGSSSVLTGTTVAVFQNAGGTCNIVPSASGGITCSSDMNLKKNITNLSDNSSWSFNNNISTQNSSVLDKVLALNPVDYNWNVEQNTDPKHAGFIAQEVQQVFPDLVSQDPKTHLLALNYTGLVPYTVEAVKEMNLNITDISDMTRQNSWRDAIIGWFANTSNGIGDFVAGRLRAKDEICINQTCVTESQLKQVLQNSGTSGQSSGGGSAPAPSSDTSTPADTDTTTTQSADVTAPTPTTPVDTASPVVATPTPPTPDTTSDTDTTTPPPTTN